MKGMLVFGNTKENEEWLSQMDEVWESYTPDTLQTHPCGLILQTAAMLNAAVWQDTGKSIYAERANRLFDKAICSLALGKNLLQFLSNACQLRRALFLTNWKPTNENKRLLTSALEMYINKASEFGLTLSNIQPEEALTILRFNYW